MIPAKIPDWLKTDSNLAVAAISASSACLRAVMSRTILEAPTILPSLSLIGEIESETSSRRAVLRQAHGLVVLDVAAGAELGEDLVLLGLQLVGDQQPDVPCR